MNMASMKWVTWHLFDIDYLDIILNYTLYGF